MSRKEPSAAEKPKGFGGRVAARLMGLGHRPIYRSVAVALDLKPEDDFLELGFGAGSFVKRHASHVHSVTGLDHSEDMVRLASRNNPALIEDGKAHFRQGDASVLPWEDERFSAVAAIEAFYWLEPLGTLKEVHRVLRPGGRLAVGLGMNADDGRDHSRLAKAHGMRFFSGEEIQTLFREAGFSEVSVGYSKGLGLPRIMTVRGVK